jgi:hypothetical protein
VKDHQAGTSLEMKEPGITRLNRIFELMFVLCIPLFVFEVVKDSSKILNPSTILLLLIRFN